LLEKLKGLGVNLAVAASLEIVRGFIHESLRNVTVEDLHDAIIKNTNLLAVTPESIKKTGIMLRKRFGGMLMQYKDLFTTELLLEQWFKNDYPDLYSVIINTPGGVEWFDRQVNMIKQEIIYGDGNE